MKMFRLSFAVAALLALAACTTGPRISDNERLELYRSYAGAPVSNFHYFRSLNGWTPLGDSALAVRVRPREAYLLELNGSCPELDFATAISISNQFGRVYSGFDRVVPLGRGAPIIPCRIETIRPLQVDALKQAEQEMRENIEMVERESSDK